MARDEDRQPTTTRPLLFSLSLSLSRARARARVRFITFYRIFIFLHHFFSLFPRTCAAPTIRQIARNNGTPPGDPFRMLHALALAALLAPRV